MKETPLRSKSIVVALRGCALLGLCALLAGLGALRAGPAFSEMVVHPDQPNIVAFPAQEAKFVRFVILAVGSSQPCIDELEVYGPDDKRNLALPAHGAKATASSCLAGHAIHQIEHLNDGEYGNAHSWIAAGTQGEWAQIELPVPAEVAKIVFSRDRLGQYADRTPVSFEVRLSLDGETWETVAEVEGKAARVHRAGDIPGPPSPPSFRRPPSQGEHLESAFLGEEHAWLKTYGRADISPSLVPYNGRVKEYPRHVGDDRLPLPSLAAGPLLDARLEDACWGGASRGVVRVAHPHDFDLGPLVSYEVTAGRFDDDLYLAIRTNRLLSTHVAVLSEADGAGAGVVVCTEKGLVFNTYSEGKLDESTPLDGAYAANFTVFEFRVPCAAFPGALEKGVRVGLGIGGRHTNKLGRPVHFVPSPLAIAEQDTDDTGIFEVRLSLAKDGERVTLDTSRLPVALAPGESETLEINAETGPIGPQYDLTVDMGGDTFTLHLFRYDPVERTLQLMEQLADRLDAKGVDVSAERRQLARLRKRRLKRPAADRGLFFDAREAKRRLFFRDPDLEPMAKVLFVKRRPFRPSHNYSVCFDAAFRPGGGIYVLDVPRRDGCFEPADASFTQLFDSGEGIARNPMADFALSKVYFGYRPSASGYYHIMAMNPDGSGLTQITDGPFHDYWPCPLPDGDLAFITTRCISRALCWRPQAATLFRMAPDGGDVRCLSAANLTEWAPSVMADGRIIWTRWEYLDKGADFGHTLWSIRPDGAYPDLVFGNDVIQPNGYANGREVPGSSEICCTLISHFGDLNGPIALLDVAKGRFEPEAITSITPEVPWPGAPPFEECFRDPVPLARDYFLCAHAPDSRFGLYVIDRFGNRELVYADPEISSLCPTLFRVQPPPPVLASALPPDEAARGEFVLADVYRGLEPTVQRGTVKYVRVVEEVRHNIDQTPSGEYRKDHANFMEWYASPVDRVSGPAGWPTYVAKAPHGVVPVEADGSARFYAPAGKVLYFQALDKDFNELQRMRSVVQLQPGERRSCIGCHESRHMAPPNFGAIMARTPRELETPPWAGRPLSFERVVQPVLDAHCVRCHNAGHPMGLDLTATLDEGRVPASYKTLITKGLVHYADCGWNSGGFEKVPPLSLGSVKSRLWEVLDAGHHDVRLEIDEMRRIKTWIDLNCPLWPDYVDRNTRPATPAKVAQADAAGGPDPRCEFPPGG